MTGYTRFRWTILIIAAFLGGALTFKLASPLFIDRTLDESFPLAGSAVVPEGMTRAEVSGAMTAMSKIDQPMSEAMPEQMAIATDLGKLKGNIGNQNYEIPGDVEVEGQGSVVIYCVPFQVVFSVVPLR